MQGKVIVLMLAALLSLSEAMGQSRLTAPGPRKTVTTKAAPKKTAKKTAKSAAGIGQKNDHESLTALERGTVEASGDEQVVRAGQLIDEGDYATAMQVLEQAVNENRSTEAMVRIGDLARMGLGQRRDYATAIKWYVTAAREGSEEACERVYMMLDLEKGITSGDAYVYNEVKDGTTSNDLAILGMVYAKGYGVTKNAERAVDYFRRAVLQGNSTAECALGDMYHRGQGVERNDALAVQWYEKSAGHDNSLGVNQLGVMRFMGTGVAQDYCVAMQLFRQAAAMDNEASQYNLGYMLEHGLCGAVDVEQAYHWYRLSAQQGYPHAEALFPGRSVGVVNR